MQQAQQAGTAIPHCRDEGMEAKRETEELQGHRAVGVAGTIHLEVMVKQLNLSQS